MVNPDHLIPINPYETISDDNVEFVVPQNEQEFEFLVQKISESLAVSEDNVRSVISLRICHLPNDNPNTTLKFLKGCVQRSIAQQVAYKISQQVRHRDQIEALDTLLSTDPFNQQALDSLEKASNEGSALAAQVLAKYKPPENVIPIA